MIQRNCPAGRVALSHFVWPSLRRGARTPLLDARCGEWRSARWLRRAGEEEGSARGARGADRTKKMRAPNYEKPRAAIGSASTAHTKPRERGTRAVSSAAFRVQARVVDLKQSGFA